MRGKINRRYKDEKRTRKYYQRNRMIKGNKEQRDDEKECNGESETKISEYKGIKALKKKRTKTSDANTVKKQK